MTQMERHYGPYADEALISTRIIEGVNRELATVSTAVLNRVSRGAMPGHLAPPPHRHGDRSREPHRRDEGQGAAAPGHGRRRASADGRQCGTAGTGGTGGTAGTGGTKGRTRGAVRPGFRDELRLDPRQQVDPTQLAITHGIEEAKAKQLITAFQKRAAELNPPKPREGQ